MLKVKYFFFTFTLYYNVIVLSYHEDFIWNPKVVGKENKGEKWKKIFKRKIK